MYYEYKTIHPNKCMLNGNKLSNQESLAKIMNQIVVDIFIDCRMKHPLCSKLKLSVETATSMTHENDDTSVDCSVEYLCAQN